MSLSAIHEQAIAAIRAYFNLTGKIPTSTTWSGTPGRSTIKRLFGSWTLAIKAAGLTPRVPTCDPLKPRLPKKICACGKPIPFSVKIDGKKRNLNNRSQCLECQPFGSSRFAMDPDQSRGKQLERGRRKANKHYSLNSERILEAQRKQRKGRKEKLVSMLGGGCQICGYNRYLGNLVFHHVDQLTKKFELSERGMMKTWEEVLEELAKCVLVCCLHHGEIHAGLINCPEIKTITSI